jgi:hypothetical protein
MRGNTVQLQYVDTSPEQQIDVSTVGIHRSLQNEQTLVLHQDSHIYRRGTTCRRVSPSTSVLPRYATKSI